MTEMCTHGRFDAVAYGNNHIECIKGNRLVRRRNVQKMHVAFFVQLPLLKDVFDVSSNHGSVALVQLSHLVFGKPYVILLQTNIYPGQTVARLINDHFSAIVFFTHFIPSPITIDSLRDSTSCK